MTARLYKGGFDPQTMQHRREEIATIAVNSGAFFETTEVQQAHRSLRDRHRTLSVDIRSAGYVSISLVAVEVSY